MHEWRDRKQDRKKQNHSKNMEETESALNLVLERTVRRLLEGKSLYYLDCGLQRKLFFIIVS